MHQRQTMPYTLLYDGNCRFCTDQARMYDSCAVGNRE